MKTYKATKRSSIDGSCKKGNVGESEGRSEVRHFDLRFSWKMRGVEKKDGE